MFPFCDTTFEARKAAHKQKDTSGRFLWVTTYILYVTNEHAAQLGNACKHEESLKYEYLLLHLSLRSVLHNVVLFSGMFLRLKVLRILIVNTVQPAFSRIATEDCVFAIKTNGNQPNEIRLMSKAYDEREDVRQAISSAILCYCILAYPIVPTLYTYKLQCTYTCVLYVNCVSDTTKMDGRKTLRRRLNRI